MPGAKKGILPYEEFPLRRGGKPTARYVLRLRRQPPTAGSADPHVWPARCTGSWCKPPDASCASAETANPLSSDPLPRRPCSAGGFALKHHNPLVQILIVPFPFGSDLPVGYDAAPRGCSPHPSQAYRKVPALQERGTRLYLQKGYYVFRS